MAVVRELVTKLGFKVDEAGIKKADAGFKKLQQAATKLTLVIGAAGVGLAAAIGVSVRRVITLGDEAQKTADKLGITVEAAQELSFVAERAGVSTEQLNIGLRSIQRRAAEAAQGQESFAKGFRRIGVDVQDAEGKIKPTVQLLKEVADGMLTLETQADKTAVAMIVAGDAGFQLNNLFNLGSKGINRLQRRARALGFVLNEETTKELERVQDALTDMSKVTQGLTQRLGTAFIPIVEAAADSFITLFTESEDIEGVFKNIRESLEPLGKRLTAAAKAFKEAGGGLKDLADIALVGTPIILTAALAMTAAFGPLLLVAAPLAIAIGALGLAIQDMFAIDGRSSVLDQITSSLEKADRAGSSFAETLLPIFNGIQSLSTGLSDLALGGGDLIGDLGTSLNQLSAGAKFLVGAGEAPFSQPDPNFIPPLPTPGPSSVLNNIEANFNIAAPNLTQPQIQQSVSDGLNKVLKDASRETRQRQKR